MWKKIIHEYFNMDMDLMKTLFFLFPFRHGVPLEGYRLQSD